MIASLLDRALAVFAPRAALKRAAARQAFAYYEGARKNKQRKQRRATGSANVDIRGAGTSIREQARHMEQNLDLAKGVLRLLVNNTVGPAGIGVEPQPMTYAGEIHEDFANVLQKRYADWSKAPDVTGQYDRGEMERMLAASWYRDGEVLAQIIEGRNARIRHGSDIPLSVECLEADYLPLDYDHDGKRTIREGIEINAWGRPVAYHLYKSHPGESWRLTTSRDVKRVSASRIIHLARRTRFHQRRGMSEFATVIGRFDDLKDYETSESIAAKVAASMGAVIVKGRPDEYSLDMDEDSQETPREMKFRPGMVFDDLQPGESIEMLGNNGRPNAGLVDFRHAMLRAIATGPGVTFSALSKFYGGNYSAQRQELVESWIDYAVLSSTFIARWTRPIYERVINIDLLAGGLDVPSDVDPSTIIDALYIPPMMPWIDPAKEANAFLTLEQAGHASGPEIIRRRGRTPRQVRSDEINWRRGWRDAGESITADPGGSSDGE